MIKEGDTFWHFNGEGRKELLTYLGKTEVKGCLFECFNVEGNPKTCYLFYPSELETAAFIDASGLDAETYNILKVLDILMRAGCWKMLNTIFKQLTIDVDKSWDDCTMSAYAAFTCCDASKIPNRKIYIEKCKTIQPRESLWVGLK
jgi:hypothetical protein